MDKKSALYPEAAPRRKCYIHLQLLQVWKVGAASLHAFAVSCFPLRPAINSSEKQTFCRPL